MGGQDLDIGLWDPQRTSRQLLTDLSAYLTERGARVVPRRDDFNSVFDTPELFEPGDEASIEFVTPTGGDGGLIDFSGSIGHLDWPAEDADWGPFGREVRSLVSAVRPAYAMLIIEDWPELPNPSWPERWEQCCTGWVDLAQCSPNQRAAFQPLIDRCWVQPVGSGVWWTANSDMAVPGATVPPGEELATAVYRAWTGHHVQPPPPRP